jgi:hypothetical protein
MIRLPAAELLRRAGIQFVENARGGKYTTKCPSCGGPYLSVKVDKDGACWLCRDCGLSGPEAQPKPAGNGRDTSSLGKPKAIYDYQDESGRRLFQVLRFEINGVKAFRQRISPDQQKWSIKGVRLVPYKLPELIEDLAHDRPVFVVEGEEDVLILRRHNIPATCNPMGAADDDHPNKWRPEFNEFFRGADVVLCGDHDEPGRQHVRRVARNLAPVARRVRILDLTRIWPDIKPSDDVRDWFNEGGGTPEALWAAVERLPDYDVTEAAEAGSTDPTDIAVGDFISHMPTHKYIFKPSGELWPASSVNSRLPPVAVVDAGGQPVLNKKGKQEFLPASMWIDQHQPVEQMSWAPGQPQLIANRLISQGGWIERPGCTIFNFYRPPTLVPKAGDHEKWLAHVRRVFPEDADHIVKFLAHRVQRPHEKINHALVLGGLQGIGKDTVLAPVRYAVGPWNFLEVTPRQVLGRFTGFLKSVVLRINEARDLGEYDRFKFYDHMKSITAAPPEASRVDEKNLPEYYIPNLCGVVITTNYKTDGIYLPADDRRHFVAWSPLTREEFETEYWTDLYRWFAHGGNAAVAAYLASLDLSNFDPKAPPPQTAAFRDIVDAHRALEDAELADVLDILKNPDVVTLKDIIRYATGEFGLWLNDRKNRRAIPHRFQACDYVPVRNPAADDGLWRINKERQVIYGKVSLALRDRLAAAGKLVNSKGG